jgi:hypothetical protein
MMRIQPDFLTIFSFDHLNTCKKFNRFLSNLSNLVSDPDPDPVDLDLVKLYGSYQCCGSGSGSFCHQAKIKKTLIPTAL